jgi:hypothetical protein
MNKPIITALALMLASSGAWGAKMVASCNPAQIDPKAPADVRERIQTQCAFFDAGRDCDKQARNQNLAGSAKKDFLTTCVKQAINRSQWQRR